MIAETGFLLSIIFNNSVEASLFPLVVLALLLDSVIVSIWYMFGVVLNNSTVRGAARSEFYQLVGTIILTILLIYSIWLFGSAFTSAISNTIFGPAKISALCKGIELSTPLHILQPYNSVPSDTPPFASTYSFLGGWVSAPASSNNNFPGLCAYVNPSNASYNPITYPLAAAGVIAANLTNQTATNLNSIFLVDAFLGYQTQYMPGILYCQQIPMEAPITPCEFPPTASLYGDLVLFLISGSYQPFSGYSMPDSIIYSVGELMAISLEIFTVELTTTAIFLYVWPILLFVGLVLRATPFTRKIGGLFIAIAIGVVVFYPLIFGIEYLTLGNGLSNVNINATNPNVLSPTGLGAAYGFNGLTTNSLTEIIYLPESYNASTNLYSPAPLPQGCTSAPCQYITNFYVQPNIAGIARQYSCWPVQGSLFNQEAIDTGLALIPISQFYPALLVLIGNPSASITSPPYAAGSPGLFCGSIKVEQLAFEMMNVYGTIGVSSYFIPLINLIITITVIIGISGLLGGDTSLAGLSRIL